MHLCCSSVVQAQGVLELAQLLGLVAPAALDGNKSSKKGFSTVVRSQAGGVQLQVQLVVQAMFQNQAQLPQQGT